MNPTKTQTIHDEVLMSKIYVIRQQKVMIDKDLAELYGVKAIRLREQVKRNKTRFPANSCFNYLRRRLRIWYRKMRYHPSNH